MSWLFSRALVEASSGGISSDGGLYAPSSATPTPQVFSLRVKTTDVCRRFPSGTTCERLTDARGAAVLTWCLAASPVRTSPTRARVQESPAPAPVYGPKWRGSSVRWDRDSSSWKTVPCSPAEASTSFSGIWPRWGMMHDGVCSEQLTPVRPTSGSASGSSESYPTPTAQDSPTRGNRSSSPNAAFRPGLAMMAARSMWPTPRKCSAMAAKITPESAWAPGRFPNLETVVGQRTWPTPTASDGPTPCARDYRDYRDNGSSPELARHSTTLATHAGGPLNPLWVEWLMGWPLGWTDLRPLETDKFRQWQASHGVDSQEWDSILERTGSDD